jgi:hypothetical protein
LKYNWPEAASQNENSGQRGNGRNGSDALPKRAAKTLGVFTPHNFKFRGETIEWSDYLVCLAYQLDF